MQVYTPVSIKTSYISGLKKLAHLQELYPQRNKPLQSGHYKGYLISVSRLGSSTIECEFVHQNKNPHRVFSQYYTIGLINQELAIPKEMLESYRELWSIMHSEWKVTITT